MGAVPSSFGPSLSSVDWLPIDLLAEMLLELSLQDSKRCRGTDDVDMSDGGSPARVFHLLNPRPVAWTSLLLTISSALVTSRSNRKDIETVSLGAWTCKVRASAEACDGSDVEAMLEVNPAAKILKFFEGLEEGKTRPAFRLAETMETSSKLRAVQDGVAGKVAERVAWHAKHSRATRCKSREEGGSREMSEGTLPLGILSNRKPSWLSSSTNIGRGR